MLKKTALFLQDGFPYIRSFCLLLQVENFSPIFLRQAITECHCLYHNMYISLKKLSRKGGSVFSALKILQFFSLVKIVKCTFNQIMFCCLVIYWKSPYCLNPCMPWALSHRWAVDDHFLTQNSATWKIYSALTLSIYEPQTVKAWFFNRYDL